ncbi:MAG: hypothetical protein U5Q44_09320 [Dehalococcoidia bacterium]|nr:hypothetical protein [Dehalococcoidia bacterium]
MKNRFKNTTNRRMPRRRFLQASGLSGAGVASWALVGCGDDDDDDGNGNGGTSNGEEPTVAPSGTASRSRVARLGSLTLELCGLFDRIRGSDHQVLWAMFSNLVDNVELQLDAERVSQVVGIC